MATRYTGYMGKILDIDLSHRLVKDCSLKDQDLELFLGGKGLAAKILYDELERGVDPLSEANILVITTGPLTGSNAPCSSRFNISSKSPMTGGIASSNCGGSFGIHLKKAGYDGLIIRGKSKEPLWIEINDDKVDFLDASELWGANTEKTQEMMKGKGGKIVIGPAGENLVRFACVMSGERTAGRCGLGAVMGSKKLKGIMVSGTHKIQFHDQEKFKKSVQKWINTLKANPITGNVLPKLGTANLVRLTNATHTLPYKNFSQSHWDMADEVSGEKMADGILVKNSGCISCPIRCERRVKLKDGKIIKGPEFETVGIWGPNIANPSIENISEWNYLMDLLGMDTISTGGTIALAMELAVKGCFDLDVSFGKTDKIGNLIEDIAYRRGIGNDLAEGSMRLAQKYGGNDIAMHSKGLEFAAYNPKGAVGHGLGYATSNRGGCHLNGGYLIFFEAVGPVTVDPLTPKGKAGLCVFQQNLFEAISAGGSCLFTSYAILPGWLSNLFPKNSKRAKLLSHALLSLDFLINLQGYLNSWMIPVNLPMVPHPEVIRNLTGMDFNLGKFIEAGERCYTLERLFNLREGLSRTDDALPKRLTTEGEEKDPKNTPVPLDKMLREYYRVRRWNREGIPTKSLLKKLKLDFAIPDVLNMIS